jgi:DEAD/DEAH box helicase
VANFITAKPGEPIPESPEALFRMLRPSDPDVRHLWAHQADILRDYSERGAALHNVALELPTGAGKTLVGLLLAEFRRRAAHDRVVYLCPTIQLARQVNTKAESYGIPTVLLTGPGREYDSAEFHRYSRGSAIVVTTYSSIFNANPKLNDAQTIVLDDAHAAEQYVASPWSLELERSSAAYAAVLDIVSERLPNAFAHRLRDAGTDPYLKNDTEILGPDALVPVADALSEVVLTHASGSASYAARAIADHIGYCLLYMSWNEILIRPYIPPTATHPPFWDADQRIYMSATPGSSGELERSFGVAHIDRLPVPPGWEAHGTGRRFFVFPTAALDRAEADEFIKEAVDEAQRALVLAPSQFELDSFLESCLPRGFPVVRAADLQDDPRAFVSAPRAVLALANRYDGLDLPGEACRVIVLTGLPSATHLQERFLYDRLGAKRVLAERIRARLTQGAGRCTRNSKDYSAVIVRGQPILTFLSKSENTRCMHPELQAEIEFGLRNSEADEVDFVALLHAFLQQDRSWLAADAAMTADAEGLSRHIPATDDALARSSSPEVRCWQAIWRDDIEDAISLAQQAADQLPGPELQAYRLFWLYLAASLAIATGGNVERAKALTDAAEDCAKSALWHPRLGTLASEPPKIQAATQRAVRATARLAALGMRGKRFEEHLDILRRQLEQTDANPFELGLLDLGLLLGFEAVRPGGRAQPDSVWRDEDSYWLIFEAKTEEAAADPVSPSEVRQALTHQDWVRTQLGWAPPETAITCIVSDKTTVEKEAAGIADQLRIVTLDIVRLLAEEAISASRGIRSRSSGWTDEEVATAFAEYFTQHQLDSGTLALRLMQRPVSRMRQI